MRMFLLSPVWRVSGYEGRHSRERRQEAKIPWCESLTWLWSGEKVLRLREVGGERQVEQEGSWIPGLEDPRGGTQLSLEP